MVRPFGIIVLTSSLFCRGRVGRQRLAEDFKVFGRKLVVSEHFINGPGYALRKECIWTGRHCPPSHLEDEFCSGRVGAESELEGLSGNTALGSARERLPSCLLGLPCGAFRRSFSYSMGN